MIDVRSEPMRQPELHLEPGASAAVRGDGRYETAAREACRVLRGGAEEAREGSDGGSAEPGECSVERAAIAFVIPGAPVGKGRPKFARRGAFVTAYTPEKTASYENLVKLAASGAMAGRPPMEGAADVSIALFVTPPASWSQKKQRAALLGQVFPTSKPDIDNVIKGIFDAMNGIVWQDDKQVVSLRVFKRYSDTARASVEVSPA